MTALAALLLSQDGWDHHWWWPVWPILWIALIALAGWLILRRRDGRRFDPFTRAREILAERYAGGELTREEYRARLDDLQT